MNFSEILKQKRIEKGMTRDALAAAVGVCSWTVYHWERGDCRIALEDADKALKVLDMSITIGAAPEKGKEHTG